MVDVHTETDTVNPPPDSLASSFSLSLPLSLFLLSLQWGYFFSLQFNHILSAATITGIQQLAKRQQQLAEEKPVWLAVVVVVPIKTDSLILIGPTVYIFMCCNNCRYFRFKRIGRKLSVLVIIHEGLLYHTLWESRRYHWYNHIACASVCVVWFVFFLSFSSLFPLALF